MNKWLLRRKKKNAEMCGNQENNKKDIKKGSAKYEEKTANKVKNQIKLNVDEPQYAIKHLKEYCDIDDMEPQRKDKAVCKTCNQPFS